MPSTPSNEEQLYLELINRFRLDPDGEAARLTGVNAPAGVQGAMTYFGVSLPALQTQLAAYGPVAPLAWNGNLADAADFHNEAMIAADEQTHQAPGEPGLGQRATNAGYTWNALGENVFAFATNPGYGHGGFVIDWGYDDEDYNGAQLYPDWQSRGDGMQDPPGHRANLMSTSFTEIGISVVAESDPATEVGPNLVTQDLGSRPGYQAQFVGVVIGDADSDSFYDIGEGLSGVSVLLERQGGGSYSTTSWSSGGWQLAVPAGTYTITFSGGGLATPIVEVAVLGSINVKVDAIAGAVAPPIPTEGADVLVGTAAGETINGLGGNDSISGLAGNDVLIGGAGVDSLAGGLGDDWFYVDNAGDTVVEAVGAGNDRIFASVSYTQGAGVQVERLTTDNNAGTAAINLSGNELVNAIYGNAGANSLDGKGGADTLVGLGGDDLFIVDNAGDVIVEGAAEGANDRVYSSVSYTLGAAAYVERLQTDNNAGTAAISLTGNAFANLIYGNAGANTLDGRGGADLLAGLGGNDMYYVDNAGDVVSETAGNGTDRIFSSVSYTLGAAVAVETLTTANNAGTGAINLTGNELANTIYGNAGANVLDGKGGADTLIGLAGADTFAFTTALGSGNVDVVSGFVVADDTIRLENAVFTGLAAGALAAGAFATGTAATQADDRIVYNSATGALLFDADGSGAGAAVQFATLAGGLALTSADFLVI